MEDDEMMVERIRSIRKRLRTPLSQMTKVQEFLSEFQRIGREAGFVEPLAEFKPFWESMLNMVRASLQTEIVVEGRWTLRSRRARPVSAEEIEARVRLQCSKSLRLATAVRDAYGKLLEEGSPEDRLVQVAIAFCTKLEGSPSVLTGAEISEIKALETAAEGFIQTNRKTNNELHP